MKNYMVATVIGARQFDIEGNRMGSMFISQPTDDSDRDKIGQEVMKASCSYDLIDAIRKNIFPSLYTMEVKMKTATGGKVGLTVLALEPYKETPKGK